MIFRRRPAHGSAPLSDCLLERNQIARAPLRLGKPGPGPVVGRRKFQNLLGQRNGAGKLPRVQGILQFTPQRFFLRRNVALASDLTEHKQKQREKLRK